MSSKTLFAATLLAVHSFASINAETTLTAAPPRNTLRSHKDIAARQQQSALPLTDYTYPYSAIPYQVNPFPVGRGPQSGYNQCNSTTEGPNSQCQTMVVNSLADFCLWGSPTTNATGLIGNVEAAVVAYCSQPGHGTRVMPAGTITGAQFMRTSAYIQVTGTFNQAGINLDPTDTGGELDPHGADLLGNPLGGLVYSTGMPSAKDNTTYMQVSQWNNFVGSSVFCVKLCDPTVTSPDYCENRIDLLGCAYNMPASYKEGEFTSCEGDLQDVVGVYTSNGQVTTWSQPDVLPPGTTLPWQPRIPASSNCVTMSSAQLFASESGSVPGASTAASSSATGSASGSSSGSHSSSGKGASQTGSANSPSNSNGSGNNSGAGKLVATSGLFAVLGVAIALM